MSNLPKKGPGRPPGMPNKATADARQAIAHFVDGNAHRLTEWLDRVADGVKVENSYITMPDLPGIGFEGKSDLFKVMQDLSR